jgi:hypothetical protein
VLHYIVICIRATPSVSFVETIPRRLIVDKPFARPACHRHGAFGGRAEGAGGAFNQSWGILTAAPDVLGLRFLTTSVPVPIEAGRVIPMSRAPS